VVVGGLAIGGAAIAVALTRSDDRSGDPAPRLPPIIVPRALDAGVPEPPAKKPDNQLADKPIAKPIAKPKRGPKGPPPPPPHVDAAHSTADTAAGSATVKAGSASGSGSAAPPVTPAGGGTGSDDPFDHR
jgi:hypothetical protein